MLLQVAEGYRATVFVIVVCARGELHVVRSYSELGIWGSDTVTIGLDDRLYAYTNKIAKVRRRTCGCCDCVCFYAVSRCFLKFL